MSHVVVVTSHFHPQPTAPTARIDDIRRAFVDVAEKVTVLTLPAWSLLMRAEDDPVLPDIDLKDDDVVRVGTPSDEFDPFLQDRAARRGSGEVKYQEDLARLRGDAWWGDDLAHWRPRLESTAVRLHLQRRVDLVVCSVPSEVTLCVAARLHDLDAVPYAIDVAAHPRWTPRMPSEVWNWLRDNALHTWGTPERRSTAEQDRHLIESDLAQDAGRLLAAVGAAGPATL